ncbi:dolichyl pyrophosphate Man9GlcNAc2 alpha-1,3-glucosyltransferase-like isoform X1 [Aricia agestis]|uniref:dolichyl pyrophosphate Man9GlcNAc2 alpha-1,3-glucosyltransferase-like isoform X1 n=1 Tax=Aricia agestis TaxID=91739 RepID=UPI001C202FA6|nr:dolichyl pyrophosphate Man9GlcNAc2 alpha-1,3-glucosyltransferase-like isoform X1 [Aricia agestis]
MGRRSNPDKFFVTKVVLLPGIFLALLVRWCVASYPYSGYQKPPMYGDYEAQRHWQEITLHTPSDTWYKNTSQNDLQYWGLDYPPLTAYHSLLMGLVADWLDPESVRLFASRGYETESHKMFMRWTVFLSDLYFFVTSVLCLCIELERSRHKDDKNVFKRTDIATTLFLLYPGIILIDHGHFQYNCVSLGLFLWATFFLIGIEMDILCTILFVFALNYKQMELYHALPFFFYLLRTCFFVQPKRKYYNIFKKFIKLGITVVTTFILVWYPISSSMEYVFQIIHRLFPLMRGVFEDKVSNIWCSVNIFIKLKTIYTNEEMVSMCFLTTMMSAMISCLDLFFRFNKRKFVLSCINVSLAFFLFSFQVHEKSILLVAIPVALHFPEDPFMCFWFLIVSTFSMLPLLLKDGLLIPLICTSLVYTGCYSIALQLAVPSSGILSFFSAKTVYKAVNTNYNSIYLKFLSTIFFFSLQGMFWLALGTSFVKPPERYPDLFPVLISLFSCAHFVFFFVYFNYCQLSLPTCLTVVFKIKKN